jgi:hypothetical protein
VVWHAAELRITPVSYMMRQAAASQSVCSLA